MKPCAGHQETLWLDVYGELDPRERHAWEKHFETCSGCGRERERLVHLMKDVKEAMLVPPLSPEDAGALRHSITRKLREKNENTLLRRPLLGGDIRLAHALVLGCLLVVTLGWFGLRVLYPPAAVHTISDVGVGIGVTTEDLAIIENMEILEEMDVLEKLAQVIAQPESVL